LGFEIEIERYNIAMQNYKTVASELPQIEFPISFFNNNFVDINPEDLKVIYNSLPPSS